VTFRNGEGILGRHELKKWMINVLCPTFCPEIHMLIK